MTHFPCRAAARLLVLLASLLVLGAAQAGPDSRSRRPPSLLLIMADDLGREWLSCYGSEGHRTPRIDNLAGEGLRFENCYATPLCTPSRHQLLTGRYPFRTGWTTHHDSPRWGGQHFDPKREIAFPRLLREAGYATSIAGKWQINDLRAQPEALREHGFDEHCVWPGFEASAPRIPERFWDPYLQVNGTRPRFPERFGPDVFVEYTADFMRRHRDRPFLAYHSMVLTHEPFVETPANRGAGREGPALFPGMVDYADGVVGRLIGAVDALGLREQTLVIFTTDNGSPGRVRCRAWGREVPGGKGKLTETGIRVPFIARWPGTVPAGRVTGDLIDFSDLLPTLAELAGARLPRGVTLDGRSFAPLLRGKGPSRREWIYSQYGALRVIRDSRWKLTADGALFDLRADPHEERSLAGSADREAAAARRRLERVLRGLPEDARLPFPPPVPAGRPARGE